jgi:hypothetical protein
MANVEIEYYNGQVAVFANARYGRRGDKFVITRKGKNNVEISAGYVYGVQLTTPGGFVSAPVRPGGALRGNA